MSNLITLAILLSLTALAALTSHLTKTGSPVAFAILAIGMGKLLLVAFQFMELKKAHLFWKSAVVIFAMLFLTATNLIL